MMNPFAPLLLSFALAAAKGVTPWAHGPLPDSNAPPLEESVYSWKEGQWTPVRKSAYVHDAHGALVHAETWNSLPVQGGYQGTWSWDFAYGDDKILTGIRERVRLDRGWRDTAHQPLQVRRKFLTSSGEEADLDLIWHKEQLIWGSKVLRRFNLSGKVAALTQSLYSGSAWVSSPPTVFAYDAAGRLLSEVAEGGYRYLHTYDAQGNLLSSERCSWRSGGWEVEESETREYDLGGKLTTTVVQRRRVEGAGPIYPTEKYLHSYPGPAIHEAVRWEWDGGQWVRQHLGRERLDARSNLIETIGYNPAEDGWRESTKSEYEYDARNNPIGHASYMKEGDQWVLTERSQAGYDADNRRVSWSLEVFSMGVKISWEERGFQFDAGGNLRERTLRKLSPAGEILEGKKETYSYAPTSSLPPRAQAARAQAHPRSGRRGGTFLILEERDLRGRAVIAR